MSYDVGNFRILSGLIQAEGSSVQSGYFDYGFRVQYILPAGYNVAKSWIQRQESAYVWTTLSFEYGSAIPAGNAGGPGNIVNHPVGGKAFLDWGTLRGPGEAGLVLADCSVDGVAFDTNLTGIYRIGFDPGTDAGGLGPLWRSEEQGGASPEYLEIAFNYPYDGTTEDGQNFNHQNPSPGSAFIKVPYFSEIENYLH